MIKSSNNGMFSIPTAPSAGTAVAQSASANTYGSYVQMTASTSEADYIVAVRYALTTTNQPSYLSVAIGTGGAGSETLVGIANCVPYGETGATINGGSAAVINGRNEFPFPIPVAASTRIACKTASSIASALSWSIWLDCYKQADLVDAGVIEQGDLQTIKTQAVTCAGSVTVGAFVGNANAAIGVAATGHVSNVDTLTTYTGDTPQTGDSFARLGAPAGASIAADIAEIEAETDGIAAIPTNPYTGTPPTVAQIATAVWQDATAGDFTVASSIGKGLYVANVAPGGDGGLVIGGPGQTLKLKQLDIENSTGDAVIFKSTNANSRGFYVDSTLGPGVVFQSEKTDGIAFQCVAIIGVGSVGAQFDGRYQDIYCSQSGSFAADMTGRILGVTQSAGSFTGIGAQVDVEQWKGATAPAMTGDAFALIGTAGVGLTNLGDTRIAHLDANVSSRSTYAGGAADANAAATLTQATAAATQATTAATQSTTAATQATTAATQTTAAAIAAAVWNAATATYQAVGGFGKWVLSLLTPSVTITPLVAQITGGPQKDVTITAYAGSALPGLVISVFDNAGNPVTITGTVQFIVYSVGAAGVVDSQLFSVAGTYVGNAMTFNVPSTDNVTPGNYRWAAWELGGSYGDVRHCGGDYPILDSGLAP